MVTSMLEKAIEIEGLLRIIRDGNPLPETYILLNIKAAELAEQATCLEERAGTPEPETVQADFVMAPPETPAPSIPEVTFTVEHPLIMEEKLVASTEITPDLTEENPETAADDLSLIEEDDILLTFDDPVDFSISTLPAKEEAKAPEEEVVSIPQTDEAEDAPNEETKEDTEDEGHIEREQPEEQTEDAETEEQELTILAEEAVAPTEGQPHAGTTHEASFPVDASKLIQQPKRQIKLKSAFSLNDRFLYARELFEGNMKMFDSTLEFIEGIEDYSIIEDYFYSELEWDPENSHVAAFMDILRPHFKE